MGRTVHHCRRGLPGFGSNESLFGGPVLPQQSPLAKFPGSLGGQKTMPLPGARRLPANPFPEMARRRLHWKLF
jgi:hypothetical protein